MTESIVAASAPKPRPRRRWRRIVAYAAITVVGVLLVANPLRGILALTLLLAIFFLLEGIAEIAMALKFRGIPTWGLLLFSGLVTLVLAAIIFLGWPSTAAWVIGLLVGINMIFFGFSLVSIAAAVK